MGAKNRVKRCGEAIALIGCLSVIGVNRTLAQITPDTTLGTENTVVTPNIKVKGVPAELIEGGAIRDINLFHSFLEFNIGNGERVYFASPTGIENIITRVTGNNPSNILGTLGVDGKANLFFLNPNGIIFGQNAQLDITGSLTATTADSLLFDGFTYSATEPVAPSILKISVPLGLQFSASQPAAIINTGKLTVGRNENLNLLAGTLINTGQLVAPEGRVILATLPSQSLSGYNDNLAQLLANLPADEKLGLSPTEEPVVKFTTFNIPIAAGDIAIATVDQVASIQAQKATLFAINNLSLLSSQISTSKDLNLIALNTVTVRDTVSNSFSVQAGKNLYIQGNKNIDILALNHPQTPFQSAGNLSLVSNGIISGDAHFSSGGKFSILNLLGQPGTFVSLYDPIISSKEDVILGSYSGNSLKIESMGSINIDNITIKGRDTTLTPSSDPDIDILRSSPALILRAGVDKLEHPPTIPNPPPPTNQEENPIIITSTSVYDNDFEGNIGSELSQTSTETTPIGNRRFLGQFYGPKLVNLSLNNLDPHQSVTLSFDLFILQSWDGNEPNRESDVFGVSVDGGLSLLNATFSNQGDSYAPHNRFQTYPDNYNPSSLNNINNPARTGAIENDTLGYTKTYGDLGTRPLDSVYKLMFTFPHSDNTLGVQFFSQGTNDESWGLDNVLVSIQQATTPNKEPSTSHFQVQPDFKTSGTQSSGNITAGNIVTFGGPVIFSAKNDIKVNGVINAQGGDILFNSQGSIDTSSGQLISEFNKTGGQVTLQANGDITTGLIKSYGQGVSLISGRNINTIGGALDTFAYENGGTVNIIANGDIALGEILASGDTGGGNITIKTNGNVNMDGIFIARSDAFNSGRGGDFKITANNVTLTGGYRIITGTQKAGAGGNLTINADTLALIGNSEDGIVPTLISTATGSAGDAGTLTVNTRRLIIKDGAVGLGTGTSGSGRGGDLIINASESVELLGPNFDLRYPTGLSTDTIDKIDDAGNFIKKETTAGNLFINTKRFIARDGAIASSSTFSSGNGGNLYLQASESVELIGTSTNGFASGLYNQAFGNGNAGDLVIKTPNLIIRDGALITAKNGTTIDAKVPVSPQIDELLRLEFNTIPTGKGGNIEINTANLTLENGGQISAQSQGQGNAGNINISASEALVARNGSIKTSAQQAAGGKIQIAAKNIRLNGNSDIATNIFAGAGGGGDITLTSDVILAFDDSDILSFARDGKGGNITFNTPAFFGYRYQPTAFGTDPVTLDGNNRVDINASGTVNGLIILPDVSFIQNSLTKLPENLINTDNLIANSCIVRNRQQGSFTITGSGGLPTRPGDASVSPFPVGEVRSIPSKSVSNSSSDWKRGDPIVEPTGVYRLPSGKVVLHRECS